jgi:hypothetical protein
MSAAQPRPQQQPLLPDAQVSDRDWLARAWERLSHGKPRYAAMTLDQALAQPVLQRLVTGCAKVMRADAARWQAEEARVDRYGARPVRPQRRHAVRHFHSGRRP